MKKTFLLFTILFFASFCKADQLAYITKDEALKATEYIRGQSTIILWCACCEGNNPKRLIKVSNVYYEATGVEQYYHVMLEGTDNNQKKIKEELDLAYVHVNKNGMAVCLGKELGLECKPCTVPFPFSSSESNSSAESSNLKVTCSEANATNSDGAETITRKCNLDNYTSVTTGTSDYKGRFSYEYSLYKTVSGNQQKINNNEMFNDKQSTLLSLINTAIKKDFDAFSSDSETKDCFVGMTSVKSYSMNELGIDFSENEIKFNIDFGLSSACMSVGGTTVTFKLNEIIPYLNSK